MTRLTAKEWFLLRWLGEEDYSLLGECEGADLDTLIAKGLAEKTGVSGYTRVTLTEKGQRARDDSDDGLDALRAAEKETYRRYSAKGPRP
jgi:hypothetical protein